MINDPDYNPSTLSVVAIPTKKSSLHEESFRRLMAVPTGKALLFPLGIFTSQTHARNVFNVYARKAGRRVHTRIDKEGIYVWLINNA